MIGMLMGDENRGQGFGSVAGGMETPEGFFAGETGVDQDTGPLRGNEGRIAGARRRENRNLYDGPASKD